MQSWRSIGLVVVTVAAWSAPSCGGAPSEIKGGSDPCEVDDDCEIAVDETGCEEHPYDAYSKAHVEGEHCLGRFGDAKPSDCEGSCGCGARSAGTIYYPIPPLARCVSGRCKASDCPAGMVATTTTPPRCVAACTSHDDCTRDAGQTIGSLPPPSGCGGDAPTCTAHACPATHVVCMATGACENVAADGCPQRYADVDGRCVDYAPSAALADAGVSSCDGAALCLDFDGDAGALPPGTQGSVTRVDGISHSQPSSLYANAPTACDTASVTFSAGAYADGMRVDFWIAPYGSGVATVAELTFGIDSDLLRISVGQYEIVVSHVTNGTVVGSNPIAKATVGEFSHAILELRDDGVYDAAGVRAVSSIPAHPGTGKLRLGVLDHSDQAFGVYIDDVRVAQ